MRNADFRIRIIRAGRRHVARNGGHPEAIQTRTTGLYRGCEAPDIPRDFREIAGAPRVSALCTVAVDSIGEGFPNFGQNMVRVANTAAVPEMQNR